MYDSRVGRWLSVDPAGEFLSPYVGMGNDPGNKTDPSGGETESVHIDKYGNVLKNIDDRDNGVYLHASARSWDDISKAYSSNNTSANGLHLDDLGGSINITSVLYNILDNNKAIAGQMNKDEWILNVLPHADWDLKNNNSLIFGVAWNYDITSINAGNISKHTKFRFGSVTFEDAAAVGNFHAGYTGIYARVPKSMQYTSAGLGEIAKFHNMGRRMKEIVSQKIPYGDELKDYKWNTVGMKVAESQILKFGRPVRLPPAIKAPKTPGGRGGYYPYY